MVGSPKPDEITLVVRVLEEFRRLDPDLPIQYALSFLTIAQREGMSMGELAQHLGIAQSSASRNIAALSKWHSFGKAGHDLVEAHEDPRERRRKLVQLTPKGKRLVKILEAIMGGDLAAAMNEPPTPAPAPEPVMPHPVAVATRRGRGGLNPATT
ncbi:MAG TPA: MarR family transcriptional regulator [Aliidongia sp.]|nr:MarR family transcriptional regulator [Aliidongia sp.]